MRPPLGPLAHDALAELAIEAVAERLARAVQTRSSLIAAGDEMQQLTQADAKARSLLERGIAELDTDDLERLVDRLEFWSPRTVARWLRQAAGPRAEAIIAKRDLARYDRSISLEGIIEPDGSLWRCERLNCTRNNSQAAFDAEHRFCSRCLRGLCARHFAEACDTAEDGTHAYEPDAYEPKPKERRR